MKTLALILALTFFVMFSRPSFAEWMGALKEKIVETPITWTLRELKKTMGIFIGGI